MTADLAARAPLVAIVGRPNVGKSALFNRLVGRRTAIVEDLPGTTRDRLYGEYEWRGRWLRVVDTGGLEAESEGPFSPLIRRQIELAIEEANAILFVVDTRDGLTAADLEIAQMLRRVTKPLLLVANKTDNRAREGEVTQFYELGLGDPFPLSAYHGHGVADLMDALLTLVPSAVEDSPASASLRIAIIGRPNAGKSALVNALLGEERMIVSEIPGTTRDVIDTELVFRDHPLTLLDTAGMRRRGKIDQGVERHSVQRAQSALERADVAITVMDVSEIGAAQDMHVVGMASDATVGIVVAINKTDLMEAGEEARDAVMALMREKLKFVPWAPIVFISATERRGLSTLLNRVIEVGEQRHRRVPTGELNQVVQKAVAAHSPRSVQGRRINILYVTQAEVSPPTFVFFVNDAKLLHFGYERYLEGKLREHFGFAGTGIKLIFKSRGEHASAAGGGGKAARP